MLLLLFREEFYWAQDEDRNHKISTYALYSRHAVEKEGSGYTELNAGSMGEYINFHCHQVSRWWVADVTKGHLDFHITFRVLILIYNAM